MPPIKLPRIPKLDASGAITVAIRVTLEIFPPLDLMLLAFYEVMDR